MEKLIGRKKEIKNLQMQEDSDANHAYNHGLETRYAH